MEIHLKIIGIIIVGLSIAHIIFPKYFNWKDEMTKVSLINKEMMYVHTFFIALTLLLMGLFCITESYQIITTHLGKQISLGFAIFWFARLSVQFFGYSSILWKGKRFETFVHILFSCLWLYFCTIFFVIYFR